MIVNIHRDGVWTNPEQSTLNWGSAVAFTGATPVFNNSGSVNVDKGSAYTQSAVTTTAAQMVGIGCLMTQFEDNTPFRVKANTLTPASLIVGYADASPTGADDNINEPWYVPFLYEYDNLIQIPYSSSYDGRAIAIGLFALPGAVTGSAQVGQISVQCLAVKPPTMQNAVS